MGPLRVIAGVKDLPTARMPSAILNNFEKPNTRKRKKGSDGDVITVKQPTTIPGTTKGTDQHYNDGNWMDLDDFDDDEASDVGSDDSFGGKFVDDEDGERGNEQNPITLDSDAVVEFENGLEVRPWRRWDVATRVVVEESYCHVMTTQVNETWAGTEDYQRERDKEMLQYMQDYPLPDWVIPQRDARLGYHRLLERSRWRALGQPIFGFQRHTELIPGSTPSGPPSNRPNVITSNLPAHRSVPQAPRDAQGSQANGQRTLSNPQPPGPPHPPGQEGSMRPPPPQVKSSTHLNAQRVRLVRQENLTQKDGTNIVQQMPPPGMVPQSHVPRNTMAMPVNVQMPPGHPGMFYGPGNGQAVPPFLQGHPAQDRRVSSRLAATSNRAYNVPRKSSGKRYPPQSSTPEPPPPTPPYPKRQKPAEAESKLKTNRRIKRKQAEADDFPWTRQMDFATAKAYADWDMSIYSKQRLDEMEAVRKRNAPAIELVDKGKDDQQRRSALLRSQKLSAANKSSAGASRKSKREDDSTEPEARSSVEPNPKEKEEKEEKGDKDVKAKHADGNQEAYHSGNFAFASVQDQALAESLGFHHVSDLIDAGVRSNVPMDLCDQIFIIWAPSKKANYQNLDQARFTVKDSVMTRKQFHNAPILTPNAARSIVDFCPDLLWRDTLLRLVSEAGFGNKEIRDRYCHNGCLCDKATITKRISAALGQKQKQGKTGGYGPGEEEWYNQNSKEYRQYTAYFAHSGDRRHGFRMVNTGVKRKSDAISDASSEPATPATPATLAIRNEGPEIVVNEAEQAEEDEDEFVDAEEEFVGEGGEFVHDGPAGSDKHESDYMMSGGNPDAPSLVEQRARSPVAGIVSTSDVVENRHMLTADDVMVENDYDDDWVSVQSSDALEGIDQD